MKHFLTENGKAKFIYSWRLEPTDKLPQGKKPCLSLREMEKKIGYDLDSQMDPSMKNMTVMELVRRYLATRTGAKPSTLTNYKFVLNLLEKEDFGGKRIGDVKTSDAKLFLIKMQADGKGYSSVKTVRGVLRPAFQMAVDDDYLQKNPFGFQLAGVVINDSVTREAINKDQMRKFLKFVHDDNNYCRYYEAFYILFHTGMRISEFCGLTIHDLDMEKRIIDINKQLQRTSQMEYMIESTKTNAGTRKLPMTEEVSSGREDGWRLYRISVPGQERHAGSGDALGAPVQPCGEPLQRDLPGTAAEHHSARLPPYLL